VIGSQRAQKTSERIRKKQNTKQTQANKPNTNKTQAKHKQNPDQTSKKFCLPDFFHFKTDKIHVTIFSTRSPEESTSPSKTQTKEGKLWKKLNCTD
jgi:hypothetical protein